MPYLYLERAVGPSEVSEEEGGGDDGGDDDYWDEEDELEDHIKKIGSRTSNGAEPAGKDSGGADEQTQERLTLRL